jgi:hypothetical protein
LDDSSYGFRDEGLSSPLVSFNPFDGKRKAFMGATWVSTFRIDHPDLEQKTTFKVRGFDGAPMLFFLAEELLLLTIGTDDMVRDPRFYHLNQCRI